MTSKFSFTTLLVGVLLLSTLASLALCARYVRTLSVALSLQQVAQRRQAQTVVLTRNRAILQAMAADAIEFSKHNAAMGMLLSAHGPLLEQLNLKPKNPSAVPAPAATQAPVRR